jgi:hypothetical protein
VRSLPAPVLCDKSIDLFDRLGDAPEGAFGLCAALVAIRLMLGQRSALHGVVFPLFSFGTPDASGMPMAYENRLGSSNSADVARSNLAVAARKT